MFIPRSGLRILFATLLLGGMIGAQVARPAFALSVGGSASLPGGFTETLLAKAQPDECFNGIGNPYPPGPPCATGQPKVNQAYVWGLTKSGSTLWFGTVPNVECLGGAFSANPSPQLTSSHVCEYGESQYVTNPPNLPAGLGDWRPPHIYSYNLTTKTLTDQNPSILSFLSTVKGTTVQWIPTLGMRSAGILGDTIFFAGPSILNTGVDLYAFSASTGSIEGYWNLTQFDDVRKWLVANGVLYVGMHNVGGGGSILAWNGTLPASGTLSDASSMFTTVGTVDGEPSELALYNNHIFVNTWPDTNGANVPSSVAGLWMGPTLPTTANQALPGSTDRWTEVWKVTNYEPDPVTASTYGGGVLMAFGGYLYWGTMHVPLVATYAYTQAYGQPTTTLQEAQVLQNTWRALAFFRGKNFGTSSQNIQLLYGEKTLPAWVPGTGWVNKSTNASPPLFGTQSSTPLYGKSGFGNKFNGYTWSMAIYKNQLFVGTMDWSSIYNELITTFQSSNPLLSLALKLLGGTTQPGADLVRFPSATQGAVTVSTNGLGNPTSYGIRNLIADSDGMFAGMSNPMNLLTNPTKPMGGWELIKIK